MKLSKQHILGPHCATRNEGTNEKLDCDVELSGPTTPNVTWLGGNAKQIQGETFRTPTSTRVLVTSQTSNGPFECRVSDDRLNRAKTACYVGGRITDSEFIMCQFTFIGHFLEMYRHILWLY